MKRTDIQKVSTYDYTKYKHKPKGAIEDTSNGDDSSIYFGATKTYETNNKYPKMWNENDKDWTYEYDNENKTAIGRDKECKIWEAVGKEEGQMGSDINLGEATTTFKQSYYYHKYKQNEFINDAYYDLIFKKTDKSPAGEYWLAGRYVLLYENYCDFGLQIISAAHNESRVGGKAMLNAPVGPWDYSSAFRPIVSIDLTSNGYTMAKSVDENGKTTVTLNFGNE